MAFVTDFLGLGMRGKREALYANDIIKIPELLS